MLDLRIKKLGTDRYLVTNDGRSVIFFGPRLALLTLIASIIT